MAITDLKPTAEDYRAAPAPRKALDDRVEDMEPTFTLRAQDALAPAVIRMWCEAALLLGVDPDKIRDARQIALRMEQWPHRKVPD